MSISRRSFVAGAAALGLPQNLQTAGASSSASENAARQSLPIFDPWIQLNAESLSRNVDEISRLSDGVPILAVLKNNAYGLGIEWVGAALERHRAVTGFAVVKVDEAMRLRDAGVTKPILFMGMASDAESVELARRDISLSLYTDDAKRRIETVSRAISERVSAHLYLDTGMGRMGMPYHRAGNWISEILETEGAAVQGAFMAFSEESQFDREQLRRFLETTTRFKESGALPLRHAASSNAVFHLPEARLDLVRPGIGLYGGYPSRPQEEREIGTLHMVASLHARVVRVEQLRVGDSVSYGRNYVAERPTWIATLPVGHADGYRREAVGKARVLIGGNLYPVIGAVSASHTIVEIGAEKRVNLSDVATLMGPDHPEIHPNNLAQAMGVSVYDLFMHLNPELPRIPV